MTTLPCDDPLARATRGQQISSSWLPTAGQVQTGVEYAGGQLTGTYGGSPAVPAVPTVSLVLSDNDVTVTIAGDGDVTNYLYYRAGSDSSWQSAGSREGDGDITKSDIAYDVPYVFIVKAVDGSDLVNYSQAYIVTATETVASDFQTNIEGNAEDWIEDFDYKMVNYLPSGGGSRSIKALVDYEGQEASPIFIITVENDSTTGISSSEVNRGGDKVQFTDPITGNSQSRRIVNIVDQDAAIMVLSMGLEER
jgi:hypothetical protein